MQLTLLQIEGKVREFAAIINAPEEFIPTFGYSNESGLPHVEVYNDSYTNDTNYQSLRMRLFQAQKNIISKINLSYMSKIKVKQDTMKSELVMA